MKRIVFFFCLFLINPAMPAGSQLVRPGVTGIAYVRFYAKNVEQSRNFYNTTLGLPVMTHCPAPVTKVCITINGNQELRITEAENDASTSLLAEIAFATPEADAMRRYLLRRGLHPTDITSRSSLNRQFSISDPEGLKVTFVSVTQSFNTTTSMGRLTLNILLSFAQFEREVIGERIRDKFAASRKRGMWMGGWAPLGYDVKDRKLIVNEIDAKLVRSIFQRFVKTGSATVLAQELIAGNVRNKYGKLIDKGILYKLLNNPVYIGVAVHKGVSYPGEHVGIIDQKVWNKVQARFQEGSRKRAATTRAQTPSLLKGLIFGPTGTAMSPTHTRKNGRLYRYYLSQTVLKQGSGDSPIARVPAAEIEKIVIDQVRLLLLSPEIIVQTWRTARKSIKGLAEFDVRTALKAFDPLWNQLFPAEQARIIGLLVERVDVRTDRVDINLRIAGVTSLLGELTNNSIARQDAA